ncbi:MAG: MgtC/SapB family protein [Clostridia bacterium]|nr:MgtC/SapB family protein [Clostridia bacterium]
MEEILAYLRDFNFVSVSVRVVLCMLIGGVLGIERGKQGRAAGMRTHILVCIGAALAAMIGMYTVKVLGMEGDALRVAAQVVSGIGFLGVGTILLKGRFQITGLTTAAGLWTVAAIGLCLGVGFYEGALVAFVCVLITVTVAHRLEYAINKRYRRFGIYVEIKSDEYVRRTIEFLSDTFSITDVQVTAPRSATSGNVGIEANVHNRDFKTTPELVSTALEAEEYVVFALESI